jgi:hypothetical protein
MRERTFTEQNIKVYTRSDGRINVGKDGHNILHNISVEDACALANTLVKAACYVANQQITSVAAALGDLPQLSQQVERTQQVIEEHLNRFESLAEEITES